MTEMREDIREHYRSTGLTERLKTALEILGPPEQRLTPVQLAALDQFHTRGLAATTVLASLAGLSAGMTVLDIGSGIGGPARFLAATYGCRVTGIDLSPSFVEAARYLTERTGQSGQVSFEIGDALALPFDDGCFDAVFLQHVAMNIADRAGLYREIRRVLRPGGKFATFDVVLNGERSAVDGTASGASTGDNTTGDHAPLYPLPWARSAATSFLLTAAATRAAIDAAGFRMVAWQDDTEAAKAWFAQLRTAGPPPSPNLSLVMGADFPELAGNLGKSLMQGRLGVVSAVFEAAAAGN